GGPMVAYALRDLEGRLAGGCEARRVTAERVDVSYWVFPAFRRRGYAGRALRLLGEAALAVQGVDRLEAHIDADNPASRRVAEGAGFVESGTVEDEAPGGGVRQRLLYVRPAPIRSP
ncbi:MAG: GNAT family N-acetyltransferase, partial [Caulobacteraceae bacterium]